MRIQRLDIENFRGIRRMRIDFHPQLNVFAGKNGIGKTTILNALGKTIDIARLNHVTGNERKELESWGIIQPNDIQSGVEHASVRLQFSLMDKPVCTNASSIPEEITSDLIAQIPYAGIQLPHRTFHEGRSMSFGAYAPTMQKKNMVSGVDPVLGAIVDDAVQYGYIFAWISDREAIENSRLRKFIDSGKDFKKDIFKKDETLQIVKKVIADITGFSGLFDDREKTGFTIKKKVESDEETLLFSQLSSGEQHLVAFITTIAVFLAINFPKEKNCLHGEAVFLIDAIELHLHPSWQREIIPKLLSYFPNCQFIITTHSPQVLGNVKPESVFLLKKVDNDIVHVKPEESYGMTMDRLLELVMDDIARPADSISKKLETLFENISRKEFDEALKISKDLKREIPTDPDLIRAEMLLHMKGERL